MQLLPGLVVAPPVDQHEAEVQGGSEPEGGSQRGDRFEGPLVGGGGLVQLALQTVDFAQHVQGLHPGASVAKLATQLEAAVGVGAGLVESAQLAGDAGESSVRVGQPVHVLEGVEAVERLRREHLRLRRPALLPAHDAERQLDAAEPLAVTDLLRERERGSELDLRLRELGAVVVAPPRLHPGVDQGARIAGCLGVGAQHLGQSQGAIEIAASSGRHDLLGPHPEHAGVARGAADPDEAAAVVIDQRRHPAQPPAGPGVVNRPPQRRQRLLDPARRDQVASDPLHRRRVRAGLQHRGADGVAAAPPVRGAGRFFDGLAEHPVRERPAAFQGPPRGEPLPHEGLDEVGGGDLVGRDADRRPLPRLDLQAQRGSQLEGVSIPLRATLQDPLEPLPPQRAEIVRKVDRRPLGDAETGLAGDQHAAPDPVFDELRGEQRVPPGSLPDARQDRRIEPQQATHEAGSMVLLQRPHDDLLDLRAGQEIAQQFRFGGPVCEQVVADREHDRERAVAGLGAEQVLHQLQGVGPHVDVVQPQDRGAPQQHLVQRPLDQRVAFSGPREANASLVVGAGGADHLGQGEGLVVRAPNPPLLQEEIEPRFDRESPDPHAAVVAGEHRSEPVRGAPAVVVQGPQVGGGPDLVGPLAEPGRQRALAEAGGPAEHDHLGTIALPRLAERGPQLVAFGDPPHDGEVAKPHQSEPGGAESAHPKQGRAGLLPVGKRGEFGGGGLDGLAIGGPARRRGEALVRLHRQGLEDGQVAARRPRPRRGRRGGAGHRDRRGAGGGGRVDQLIELPRSVRGELEPGPGVLLQEPPEPRLEPVREVEGRRKPGEVPAEV